MKSSTKLLSLQITKAYVYYIMIGKFIYKVTATEAVTESVV